MNNSYSTTKNDQDHFMKVEASVFPSLIKIHGLVMKIVLGYES